MALISMVGCNAVGKTTAARRWSERYGPRLLCVLADVQTELCDGVETRVKATKGTAEEKADLVARYRDEPRVVLFESARTSHLPATRPGEPVIIVTCDWQLYEKHMRARCAAKGKRFRDDYWDERKLRYESGRRYSTFSVKYLAGYDVRQFEVRDQAADWVKIDEYFGMLFRRLHNELNRRRG